MGNKDKGLRHPGKPFRLDEPLRLWADLVELGFYQAMESMTQMDILYLWLDRQNKKGFEYEYKSSGEKGKIISDFSYFIKRTPNG